MTYLKSQLELQKCPHCHIDLPNLVSSGGFQTEAYNGDNRRYWKAYVCVRCGGAVIAASESESGYVSEVYPSPPKVDEDLPERAKNFLEQAISSIHAPSGAIVLAASAVDAMLKEKGYKDGVLNDRIKKAAADHLITKEMAEWAHEVRLEANIERHSDEDYSMPTERDARRSIEFTRALGMFLYVLPARVEIGRAKGAKKKKGSK